MHKLLTFTYRNSLATALFLLILPPYATASGSGKPAVVEINTTDTTKQAPKEQTVPNGTSVSLSLTKRTIETCTVESKRMEIAEPANPIASILGIATKALAGGFTAAACPLPTSTAPVDANATRVTSLLSIASTTLQNNLSLLSNTRKSYTSAAEKIQKFVNCEPEAGKPNPCSMPTDSENALNVIKADVDVALATYIPNASSVESLITAAREVVETFEKTATMNAAATTWLIQVNGTLDCLSSRVAFFNAQVKELEALRTNLNTFRDSVQNFGKHEIQITQLLRTDRQAKVDYTVTCVNYFTKQQMLNPVTFRITYQNDPRLLVSAGVLLTPLDAREIGIEPRNAPKDDGSPGAEKIFSDTHRSTMQAVPFSFLNGLITKQHRTVALYLSGGIGINPNSGSNQVEYFSGAALGFKNVYFHFGLHTGKFQEIANGFQIGTVVPEGVETAPVHRRFSSRPAFAVSYKIPLP